jgi:GntR family transcriptional regulator
MASTKVTHRLEKSIPLHAQVRASIRKRAVVGDLVDEDGRLKTEAELVDIFGVSRVTVRNAIAPLVEEGVFSRTRGQGTFLRTNIQESWMGRLLGFQEVAEIENYKAGAVILSQGMTADQHADVSTALDERAVWQLKRLRTANGQAMTIEQAYYPPEIGLKLQQHNLTDIKVYEVLENEFEIDVVKARQEIRAKPATAEEGRLLDVATGTALLTSVRLTLTARDRVVEYLESIHHPDSFQFTIDLVRRRLT